MATPRMGAIDPRSQTPAAMAERVEFILKELDSLPTLGAVAVRLLELTADEDANADEVVNLVASDPALAAKVLKLCRCHEVGRSSQVTTVERAVLLLGFEAVRCAVLSVQVFEALDGAVSPGGERPTGTMAFDREAFWLHTFGVAVASERLAQKGTLTQDIRPGEAFMAGLLHEIGHLALHVLLPESFDRVCRLAETHSATIDQACRQLIGIDTHTVGKRLAEHWGLPRSLVDVIWLHGQPFDALPEIPHRRLVALVSLADALVSERYLATTAAWKGHADLDTLCIPIGMTIDGMETIAADLHRTVTDRAAALSIDVQADSKILLRAICRANESLARGNLGMRQRERLARRQAKTLDAIRAFHERLSAPATVVDVLQQAARSAIIAFDAAPAAALFDAGEGDGWRILRLSQDGRAQGIEFLRPPEGSLPLDDAVQELDRSTSLAGLLPWLAERLDPMHGDGSTLRICPVCATDGATALLVTSQEIRQLDEQAEALPLLLTWRAAVRASMGHDQAAHLNEQLVEANRARQEAQDLLTRNQTLATLGEVAAGAAHEMNNPLTIISGRAQLLSSQLKEPSLHRMAAEISEESHRLSDMISALRSFAEPLVPQLRSIDLADVVVRAVQQYGPGHRMEPRVNTTFAHVLPPVRVDPELIGQALGELVRNAVEAKGSRHIELRVQIDPVDDRLSIEVRDDGTGLSSHALRHAFDPFFSEKPAGRQPGLGLARARRAVEAHGGRVTLVNGPSGGAIATIWLEEWRNPGAPRPTAGQTTIDDDRHD